MAGPGWEQARWPGRGGSRRGGTVARWPGRGGERARRPVPFARRPALARSAGGAGELGGPPDTERGRRSWAGGVGGAKERRR
jgi:hypothetical protein